MREHIAWRGGLTLLVAGILAACSDGESVAGYQDFENGVATLSARIERGERETRFVCSVSHTGSCAFAVRGAGDVERFEVAEGAELIRRDLPKGFAHCAAATTGCAINAERSK